MIHIESFRVGLAELMRDYNVQIVTRAQFPINTPATFRDAVIELAEKVFLKEDSHD